MRMATKRLLQAGLLAGGAAGTYGLLSSMGGGGAAPMPAAQSLGDVRASMPDLSPRDAALYEGLRQGMQTGEIQGAEVAQLAFTGKLPAPVLDLVKTLPQFEAGVQMILAAQPQVVAAPPPAVTS